MSAGDSTEKSPLKASKETQYATIKPAETASLRINTDTKTAIGKAGAPSTSNGYKLNLFNKFSLTYINVINYNQRRALYPFATFFSSYYVMTAPRFAWIISAFHLGGFLAIFISPYMMHFRFHLFLIVMLLILAATNVLMCIWTDFYGLIILRVVSGLVCTITWSEVTGAIGAFTDKGAERTTGIIITESSFTITTFFYVVIGVILNDLDVTWFWLIMGIMAVFGAFLAAFLPRVSLYAATQNNAPKQATMKRIQSTGSLALVPTTPGNFDDEEDEQVAGETDAFPNTQQSPPRSPVQQQPERFSLTACLAAYGHVYHLMIHFLMLFAMSTQFSAFSVCFGEWLVVTYGLNAAQLGYFTIANTCGGVTALLISPLISKYKPNIFGIIIGCIGLALFTFIISLLVWIKMNLYILILIFFYLYWVSSQVMFLNIIVCNLDFSPRGYESTSSLLFQMMARAASFIGTVIGPNIVDWVSFPFLINVSCVLFVIASVMYTIMYRYLARSEKHKWLTVVRKK